jgi:hypothetical protein
MSQLATFLQVSKTARRHTLEPGCTPTVGAEISYNSAKEHGAARAGFDNIRPFNRLTFMKLLLSLHGFFDQFCACLALENHGATGNKAFTTIET